ncbi:DegV family protein with EDD domain [Catenuloplanes nepalensis]|uniref:DegV family protein with EDD domain n=1 Tax=Catenuloplanes nepalensis TaxID=587533 RepID=A0ABT9MJD0_9ACTN|nr:DegV family protein [Catenuloplanes nepalensis]MDP9791532.1 DegV family protein with EDD domain [Catenuloplanes nepalensis]
MSVAVVTDSTAYLPDTGGLTVVPLHVVVGDRELPEVPGLSSGELSRMLRDRRVPITTSRPAPERFVEAYRRLFDGGATGIVSVHLSARLSGTVEAAQLAAAQFGDAVRVIDSRSAGMATGFAALAAAACADLDEAAKAAQTAVERTTSLFYVDTLDFLRRGGRIGAASALVGTALSVKPILRIADGAIIVRDKVRTAGRALARLADLTVEAAGDGDADLAVHHLAAPERAAELLSRVADRLGARLRARHLTEIGAVVGAHLGPGAICAVIHRR